MKKIDIRGWTRKRRGSILAFTVIIVVLLSILGLVLIKLGSIARIRSIRIVADISARTAADGALTEAIRLMNKKLADEEVWDNSNLPSATEVPLPACSARYSFTIQGDQAAGFQIVGIGQSGIAERRVYNRLMPMSLWFGIGVKQTVNVLSKTTFSTLPEGSDFTIRTNSTDGDAVKLYPDTYVPGDVIVGPGGDPETVISTKSSSTITGDSYAAADEILFPDVIVPALPYKGALPPADPNSLITLTSAHSGIYDEINLGQGDKLHIVDGEVTIYVKGSVRLHQEAELFIPDNATVPALNLYLGGNMQADQGSLMITENAIEKGTKLKIFGTNTCTSIILMNAGDLSAAIYAPYADLELKNSGDVIGSFVGKNLEMKNSGTFTYDTRLADTAMDDDATYLMQRWWEE